MRQISQIVVGVWPTVLSRRLVFSAIEHVKRTITLPTFPFNRVEPPPVPYAQHGEWAQPAGHPNFFSRIWRNLNPIYPLQGLFSFLTQAGHWGSTVIGSVAMVALPAGAAVACAYSVEGAPRIALIMGSVVGGGIVANGVVKYFGPNVEPNQPAREPQIAPPQPVAQNVQQAVAPTLPPTTQNPNPPTQVRAKRVLGAPPRAPPQEPVDQKRLTIFQGLVFRLTDEYLLHHVQITSLLRERKYFTAQQQLFGSGIFTSQPDLKEIWDEGIGPYTFRNYQ